MKTAQTNTPFTAEQVSKMLKMDENAIHQYCRELPIRPKRDLKTGKAMFSTQDIDVLKRAREWHASGESLSNISKKLTVTNPLSTRVANKADITVIIEAVSQAKENILNDLSRLMDEKLEGMDEVVVELIKCKSENETLKQKLKLINEENNYLKAELSKFKAIKFGLYRKLDS
jgi:DNA-binding transcriptional MerR regulator